MQNGQLQITIIRPYRNYTEICLSSGFKFNVENGGKFDALGLQVGDFVYNDVLADNTSPRTTLLTFITPAASPPVRTKGKVCITNGVTHKIIFADALVSENEGAPRLVSPL